MLDYGALPPEVNSARIYAGPGSAPMVAAASAWNALAAELSSAASAYESVISSLTSEQWLGPASGSMAVAAAPYVTWMNSSAGQAKQAANQANAAAAAYEAAFTMTVPPPVIAANRAQLAALVATNVLGQNTPAIMATEAHYAEMWAQDATAMYSYAANSATASQLAPFASPAQTTNPAGAAGQAAAVTAAAGNAAGSNTQVAQLMSALPSVLQGMSSPISSAATTPSSGLSGLTGLLNALSGSSGSSGFIGSTYQAAVGGAGTSMAYIPSTLVPSMIGYLLGPGFNAAEGGTAGAGLGALLAPGGPLANLGGLGGGIGGASGAAGAAGAAASTTAATAGVGQAATVGSLTVPPGWAAATPANAALNTAGGSGWAAAPETHVAAMPPGVPPGAGGNRGAAFGAPRYGFKPTVMARPVVAG